MLDDIIDYFSKEQLADLFYRINSLANYQADEKIKATVLEKLSKKRINHLKEHLKSNNQEINQDRKNLSDKIKKLELNANYNLLLDQIDKYLETADSGAITA
jgi:predicted transcriptional regulator